jgi:anti-anti-sigma factor
MALLDIDRTYLDHDTVVLDIKGYLDAFSVAEFRHAAAENETAAKLIINLSTTFLDSAGLNALVGALRQVRDRHGDAAVVCSHPNMTGALYSTGLDRVVTLTHTVDQARSALDVLEGLDVEMVTN